MTLQLPPRIKPQRYVNAALRWGLVFLLISCVGKQEEGATRLASSKSPYLREHADNPVNWYEWSDGAFERAAKENKPVIVSIGYASCHWCHVMERESFMDPEVAKIMNENFISIKVDREERPDVDQQFIYASQALTGTAGWPLNAFALADGKPFHTITYYPKDQWIDLLKRVAAAWKEDRGKIKKQAADLTRNIMPFFEYQNPDSVLRLDLKAFLNHVPTVYSSLDFENGGVKGSPKFPMPTLLEFMLQYSHITGDMKALQWVTTTLDAMANGSLYDHVNGGFFRYSTDAEWRVPHFEKMLYDNGQLLSVYVKAYKVTKNERYKQIVNGVLDFVEIELMARDSAFISSINADSEGEEGKYYKWSDNVIRGIFEHEAEAAMAYYGIEDKDDNILRIAGSASDDDVKRWRVTLQSALYHHRTYPTTDRKFIASWNEMMVVGLLDALSLDLDREDERFAVRADLFVFLEMMTEQRVYRSVLKGTKPSVEGFLEDYAWVAKANIRFYEYTFDIGYLERARKVTDLALEKFKNENSPFFFYSVDNPGGRLIRNTELFDQAIPSSNSVFAEVLLLLGEYYQEPRYTNLAENAIKEMISSIDLDVTAISNWARLAQIVDFGPYQIAVVGENPQASSLQLQGRYLPAAIFMGGTTENLPLLENKLVEGQSTIYVCRNRVCKLPVTKVDEALRQIVYK